LKKYIKIPGVEVKKIMKEILNNDNGTHVKGK
jgi:hypothetical protein